MKWRLKNLSGKIHRVSNVLYLNKIPLLPKILMKLNRIIFSCEIPYQADIHPEVVFAHNGLGMVISKASSIGKKTQIMQNVTLGANRNDMRMYKGKKIFSPIIGENVLVGAGATIIGQLS